MKKIIFIVSIFMLIFGVGVRAQIKFGLKGGLNFTNFSSARESVSLNNSTGWHLGVTSQIKIPIIGLGIQPELIYTVAKADEGSINYIQLPLNIRYQILPGPVRPIILAGPHLSYASGFSGVFNSGINSWDWGLGLGAGVEFWKLQVAGKYLWGLQNISDYLGSDIRNNGFALSLAFFL